MVALHAWQKEKRKNHNLFSILRTVIKQKYLSQLFIDSTQHVQIENTLHNIMALYIYSVFLMLMIMTNIPADATKKLCHSIVILPSSNTSCEGILVAAHSDDELFFEGGCKQHPAG